MVNKLTCAKRGLNFHEKWQETSQLKKFRTPDSVAACTKSSGWKQKLNNFQLAQERGFFFL